MNNENGAASEIEKIRHSKIRSIRSQNVNPFPHMFSRTASAADLLDRFQNLAGHDMSEEHFSLAGRIMTARIMGKASFFHLQDREGKIQVYLKCDIIGQESYDFFKKMIDLGDIVGVTGPVFKTQTGEVTLRAEQCILLSKSLRSLPEKWHGLKDVETRYRKRYVDLIVNKEVRDIFLKRGEIIKFLRAFLDREGFREVETPLLQAIPGGAAARPFTTFHHTLDMELYLRIAPELYLKRLIVGGLEKVYEIGKCFRNEGIDARHNPEFTILELYQAFADYRGMMDLCEAIISQCLHEVTGGTTVRYRDMEISCAKPFKHAELNDLIEQATGLSMGSLFSEGRLREEARKMNIAFDAHTPEHKIFDRMFDEKILPLLVEPTFVIGYPRVFSPLAKSRENDPETVERFELFMCREEIANAYSELNDPEEQKMRFLDQQRKHDRGDHEASVMDEDYIEALEYGMPPAGGLGIGIDRLTMLFTGAPSIREVLYFPLLRKDQKTVVSNQ